MGARSPFTIFAPHRVPPPQCPEIAVGDDHSGSTAISAIVTPTHIICGNVGDSRCILVKGTQVGGRSPAATTLVTGLAGLPGARMGMARTGGVRFHSQLPSLPPPPLLLDQVVEMSVDHKPYNDAEERRIVAAGGTVTMRRVNGDLAVSRALGDFVYKHAPGRPAEQQQVSPEPEIRVQERSESDAFLVLACDGVWDVMSNADVGDFLLARTSDGIEALDELAESLIQECLARGSRDNMSAIIVAFRGAPRPSP